jgi:hypothetical protein
MGCRLLEANVGVVKVRPGVAYLGSDLVVEEAVWRDGPLTDEGSPVGEGGRTLGEAVPVLVMLVSLLSTPPSSIQILYQNETYVP